MLADRPSASFLYIVDANWPHKAVASAYAQLSTEDRVRVDRMCDSGKDQLTISLAIRRPLLVRATGFSDSELRMTRDNRGKLWLTSHPGWSFNIADTDGCVVFAVARSCAVGVDVESADRSIFNWDDFANAFLSAEELSQIAKLDFESKKEWILQAWVLKEAYTKRIGFGLSFGLNRISVDPKEQSPMKQIDGESADDRDYLLLHTGYPGYHVALSAQGAIDFLHIEELKSADFTF
jgi:phosphopantetheinyl transferase